MKESIDYSVITGFEECLPRISIIIPYSPRINSQSELNQCLTLEVDKIENDLNDYYSIEKSTVIIKKLRKLIKGVIWRRDGKNLGIFMSPCSENVYYFTPTDLSKIYISPVFVQENISSKFSS